MSIKQVRKFAKPVNHDAEQWVENYWSGDDCRECEGCAFKTSWYEDGQRFAQCEILEQGNAEDCPAWININETGEDDE